VVAVEDPSVAGDLLHGGAADILPPVGAGFDSFRNREIRNKFLDHGGAIAST
jgi:hypothetical protein